MSFQSDKLCDVDIISGEVNQFAVDFFLPGIIPFHFIRTYASSKSTVRSSLGHGWRHNLDLNIIFSDQAFWFTDDTGNVTDITASAHRSESDGRKAGPSLIRSGKDLILTESDSNRLVFSFSDIAGRYLLARKEDAYGNSISFYYDKSARLEKVIDTHNRHVRFRHNGQGQITDIWLQMDGPGNPIEPLVSYKYDVSSDLVEMIDRTQIPYVYEYHDHLLSHVTDRIGGNLYFQYDSQRRCVRTWRDNGVQFREIEVHPERRYALVKDSKGFCTLYEYNDIGLTERLTDPLGRVRTDVYDADGNLILDSGESGAVQQITAWDEEKRTLEITTHAGTTVFELNEINKPLTVTTPEGNIWRYDHDAAGSLTRMISPLDNEWRFEYDKRGFLVKAINPQGFETRKKRIKNGVTILEDDFGIITKTHFDVFSNPIIVEDGAGNRTRLTYSPAGNLVKVEFPDGNQTSYAYDGEGNLLQAIDETGLMTSYRYDRNGSLTELIEPGGQSMSFKYDTESNLSEIVNFHGEKADFTYDEVGRIIRTVYFDGREEYSDYDDTDNVVAIRDNNRQVIAQFEYDASKIVKKKYPDGTEIRVTYGGHNEILSIEHPGVSIRYERDAEMRLIKEQVGDVVLEFEYDKLGNRSSLKSNSGRTVHYDWDPRGRLIKLIDSDKFVYQYNHDVLDLVTQTVMPNGLIQHFNYDQRNRLIRRSVSTNDSTKEISRRDFEYDAAGRLIKINDLLRGSFEYSYDGREHLIEVTKNAAAAEFYQYDANENLILTHNGSTATIGKGNRILYCGDIHYQYDRNGNLTEKRSQSGTYYYDYDADNQLIKATQPRGDTTKLRYDPLGRRSAKECSSVQTIFTWDGLALLEEKDVPGEKTSYLFLPGSFLPAGLTKSSHHYSYVLDQVGTPTELLDQDGAIAWAADYTAFGEVKSLFNSVIKNPIRFQGQYYDEDLNYCYNRHRYYDPSLGRFISQDPIGFDGGHNLYLYTPNPINWIDPFGLVICEIQLKCSWSKNQNEDARKKMAAMNKQIGKGVKIPDQVPSACASRKNAKKIYEDCQQAGHDLPKLKETSSKCSNQQADHILEVCAGGGEKDCNNLQPLNQSVNASFGSQMASCAKANAGKMLTGIRAKKGCRPGGKKCPDI